ncbi:tRNA U55 pseudouridine synthase TruB [Catovirus CTV1]|uniref:tRNA pseudouridine(55) synthase n=1 Tax=Catovirus CTV1 TaxID=1977631 RepID=A0A1V0SAB3_9VIRU|nr:tRNA U55 pseudouridine synthase TruB [Catovirus CTV1]
MILELYKPIGITTVEFIEQYKKETKCKKICFAGRLDPLAHGKLCVLTDEDVYRKDEFCGCDKIYESYIIKNITTDTYDIMGIPSISYKEEQEIPKKIMQKYPPYSSVMITKHRKPYWFVTKMNLQMEEKDIPTKEVEIHSIEKVDEKKISSKEIFDIVNNRISKVNEKQNFRQTEILEKWKEILTDNEEQLTVIKVRVKCSSGTYIRNIGNMLNGCCFDICRIEYIKN